MILLKSPFENSPIGAIVVAAICSVLAVIYFFSALREGIGLIRIRLFESGKIAPSPEKREKLAGALRSFSYYKKLSPEGKEAFLDKTLIFLSTKEIRGVHDYQPDPQVRIEVAAAMAQLTFGLKDFFFPGFDAVALFPSAFRLHETAPLMKGGMHPTGIIFISVRDFKEGYRSDSDKLNVGLHELAHAAFLEFSRAMQDDPEHPFHVYLEEADRILHNGKERDEFFRDYAFSNRQEFFAVSVEHFFEAAKAFRQQLPALYKALVRLLKQDPASPATSVSFTDLYS